LGTAGGMHFILRVRGRGSKLLGKVESSGFSLVLLRGVRGFSGV